MGEFEELQDGYEDLTSKNFINVEEVEPLVNIKFFSVDEDMKINDIMAAVKEGNNIAFIDVSKILEDHGALRIFVNKIRRVSDDFSITMKLYGKNWLLLLPEYVNLHIGDE